MPPPNILWELQGLREDKENEALVLWKEIETLIKQSVNSFELQSILMVLVNKLVDKMVQVEKAHRNVWDEIHRKQRGEVE